ncbi:Zinc finger A20 and AN1 domain-containing stress-associated protein 8 [Nymphaea thermarum]|nr:Zinc finger A20 and AN1 domain-containing stress-associated protein 8 [Nymphaea thermarum]
MGMGNSSMEHDETGCQPPEGPILCINNCGFFGSAATMNMCSKCHKDLILKQHQAKLAASSVEGIVNGNSSNAGNGKDPEIADASTLTTGSLDLKFVSFQPLEVGASSDDSVDKPKEGPNRCNSCKKRVGLTGFRCKCGELFCAVHRHFEKHNCKFDYKAHARDALAKANPVIKAEKLDKI